MGRVRAGRFRHKLILQGRTTSRGDTGEARETFAQAGATGWFWGSVEPVKADEPYVAGQWQGQVSHKILCYYRAGITPSQRILYGSRVLEVVGVVDDANRHDSMTIFALERIDN